MHLPIDTNALARVVSAKLAAGNHDEYNYQEDCGSSDTTSYFKLVKKSDIHHTVLAGVTTRIATDEFEESLLQQRFDQNAAFLTQGTGHHNAHPLCPVVLAIGQPHEDFAYSWIVYKHVEGWPLAANWHQLKPEIRTIVVENIATFVRELALLPAAEYDHHGAPSIDYVGSPSMNHILFPPVLAANSSYRLSARELEGVTNHAELVRRLAESRVSMMDLHARAAGTKSLAAEQLRSIMPVAQVVLDGQEDTVMAHTNLLPQNIWINPFSGRVTAVFGWEYVHWAPKWMTTEPLMWLMDEKEDRMLESEKLGDPWMVWRPHFNHPPKNTAKEMRQLRRAWETSLRSTDGDQLILFGKEEADTLKRTAMKVCFVEEVQLPQAVGWAREVLQPFSSVWMQIPLESLLVWVLVVFGVAGWLVYFGDNTVSKSGASLALVVAIFVALMSPSHIVDSVLKSAEQRKRAVMTFNPVIATRMIRGLDRVLLKAKFPWAFGYSASTDERAGDKGLAAVPCSPANSIMPTGIYVVPSFISRAATMMSRGPTAIKGET